MDFQFQLMILYFTDSYWSSLMFVDSVDIRMFIDFYWFPCILLESNLIPRHCCKFVLTSMDFRVLLWASTEFQRRSSISVAWFSNSIMNRCICSQLVMGFTNLHRFIWISIELMVTVSMDLHRSIGFHCFSKNVLAFRKFGELWVFHRCT